MELSRINSDLMNPSIRRELLALFGVEPEAFMARGREAEVYWYSDNEVVKIYPSSEYVGHLQTLQQFYEVIDESKCGFEIPRILRIEVTQSGVAVLEGRIEGITLESLIGELTTQELHRAEDLYLQGVHSLRSIEVTRKPETYLLFDDSRKSYVKDKTWGLFYSSLLRKKIEQVAPIFKRVYPTFLNQAQKLIDIVECEVSTKISVVHGDFFPGNILVNNDLSTITGVIDFGSFTMFGNHLVDMASAFGFYKMYEPNIANLNELCN